jgi:hypothetical protein
MILPDLRVDLAGGDVDLAGGDGAVAGPILRPYGRWTTLCEPPLASLDIGY